MSTFRFSVFTVSLVALTAVSPSIVERHDRSDALYRSFAKRFNCVCTVCGDGHGTLIGDRWVLTAAHVAQIVNPFSKFVTFGKRNYDIKDVYIHPSFGKGPGPGHNDVALIELSEPVKGIKPIRLYHWADEKGKRVIFVGSGMTGNGLTGPTHEDQVWRAAENQVFETGPTFIRMRFDKPPKALNLEGISGPGDSGGPALQIRHGVTYIAGTSSTNGSQEGGECKYDSVETYGRVSTAVNWIKQTQRTKANPNRPWSAVTNFDSGWSPFPRAEPSKAYIDMFNEDSLDAYAAFNEKFRSKGTSVKPEVALRNNTLKRKRVGALVPVAATSAGERLTVLCRGASGKWVNIEFHPDLADPNRITGASVIELATKPNFIFKPK